MLLRRAHLPAIFFALALSALGCGTSTSGDAGSNDAADGGDSVSTCPEDAGAETYSPGMTATGVSGQVSISLDSIEPAPADKGTNHWVIRVTGSSGAPLDGLTVTPKPWMPEHQHGTSITPTVMPLGDGKYDISSLVLFMPGLWQVTFEVTAPSLVDSAKFSFCVTG